MGQKAGDLAFHMSLSQVSGIVERREVSLSISLFFCDGWEAVLSGLFHPLTNFLGKFFWTQVG